MSQYTWAHQFGADDGDDEDEVEGTQRQQFATRDGLVFLVDAGESMFNEHDAHTNLHLALRAVKSVMEQQIVASPRDVMAVVLFNTGVACNTADFQHVFVLQELATPGAAHVLELEALLEKEDLASEYGQSGMCGVSDALWLISTIFSTHPQKLGLRRLLLITDNDHPHGGNAQLQRQAASRVGDLAQNGVELTFIPLTHGGQPFDMAAFYKDVLPDGGAVVDDVSDIVAAVRRADHKRRAVTRLPLSVGGASLAVAVYNLQHTATAPSRVRLYKKTNEEVRPSNKMFLSETSEILMPQDIKKCQVYGGEQISFEIEELSEMKKFGTPGLQLMGFKPRSSLKPHHHVKHAQFLYPDESQIEGSTALFSTLLARCLARDVTPVCRYIPRRNAPPRFVALLPQREELDDDGRQHRPAGFHLIFLPFADDIRKLTFDEAVPRANQEQVEAAKQLVKRLRFRYTPQSFENPMLATHYASVAALALERDTPDQVADYTLPDEEQLAARGGQLLAQFGNLVFPAGYDPAKKKAPAAGGPAKKTKVEPGNIDYQAEARAGRLGNLTVPLLKAGLKELAINNHKYGQNKAGHIKAINAHFGLGDL